MVTKLISPGINHSLSSVLAKILMVTKRRLGLEKEWFCSVLAKILMVTKPTILVFILLLGSVLAKILMVTKPGLSGCTS